MTENISLSPGSMRTILITTFALTLLALILGLHNVNQAVHLAESQIRISEVYGETNAARRLSALEADRDSMREQIDALRRQVDALASTPTAAAP
jgi:hypothetical protein